MKMNETIKQNIRGEVQRIILSNIYSGKKPTLKCILSRFEERGVSISLDGLIELSEDYRSFLPPNPYNARTKQIYKDLGLKEIMSYNQFIFELPRIWYTTLYRLICEWNEEFNESIETAY